MLRAVRRGKDGKLRKDPWELAAGAPDVSTSLATGHQV